MDTLKEVMAKNLDYTFVHFHSIDEVGHDFGPMDSRTIEQIEIIDKYLDDIINNFDGQIIITSDHGMHQMTDSGDHGDFIFEDMFVPYMTIHGGNHE